MSGRIRICRPDGTIQVGYRKTDRRQPVRAIRTRPASERVPRKPVQLEIFPEYLTIEERRNRKRRLANRLWWRRYGNEHRPSQVRGEEAG
jgi:hypothetical protein